MGNELFSVYAIGSVHQSAENENTMPRWAQKKYCKIFTVNI